MSSLSIFLSKLIKNIALALKISEVVLPTSENRNLSPPASGTKNKNWFLYLFIKKNYKKQTLSSASKTNKNIVSSFKISKMLYLIIKHKLRILNIQYCLRLSKSPRVFKIRRKSFFFWLSNS